MDVYICQERGSQIFLRGISSSTSSKSLPNLLPLPAPVIKQITGHSLDKGPREIGFYWITQDRSFPTCELALFFYNWSQKTPKFLWNSPVFNSCMCLSYLSKNECGPSALLLIFFLIFSRVVISLCFKVSFYKWLLPDVNTIKKDLILKQSLGTHLNHFLLCELNHDNFK